MSFLTLHPALSPNPAQQAHKRVQFARSTDPIQSSTRPMDYKAENGVWISTEIVPAITGGFGEVTKTITDAVAEHMPQKDLRVIVPYLPLLKMDDDEKKNSGRAEYAFQPTRMTFTLPDSKGVLRNFKVWQKFEPVEGQSDKKEGAVGVWVYAIQEDSFFANVPKGKENDKTAKSKSLHLYTYNPKAGEFDKIMLFNKAAAKLITLLDGNNKESADTGLNRFGDELNKNPGRKHIDFVMAHDWLTGAVLSELPDTQETRKIFMLHNRYDKPQILKVSKQAGLFTPDDLYDQEKLYSPLDQGIRYADAVIGERNFVRTVLTNFSKGLQCTQSLQEKLDSGRIFNMHHGLSATFTPIGHLAPAGLTENLDQWTAKVKKELVTLEKEKAELKDKPEAAQKIQQDIDLRVRNLQKVKPYQFKKLEAANPANPTVQEIAAFKAHNKEQLQKKWGLDVNPNAILMGWAARLEPSQKGSYLLQKSMETILENKKHNKNYDRAQFIVFGPTDDPGFQKWITTIKAKYPNRIYMPNAFANKNDISQLNAGSDFTVLPSLYEPYGLTQLEAMKMGSIPIVHGVDGLRATINDPDMVKKIFKNNPDNPYEEEVWKMPQNGILMEPLDINGYTSYVYKRMDWQALEPLVTKLAKAGTLAKGDDVETLAQKVKAETLKRFNLQRDFGLRIEHGDKLSAAETKQYEQLKQQVTQLKQIHASLSQTNQLKPVYAKALENILGLTEEDEALNTRESNKLTEAIDRALLLVTQGKGQKAAQVRKNGFDFVNTAHSWKRIITTKYANLFENSTIDEVGRATHPNPPGPGKVNYQPKVLNITEKPVQPATLAPKNTPATLNSQIIKFWNQFLEAFSRFWSLLTRPLKFKQD